MQLQSIFCFRFVRNSFKKNIFSECVNHSAAMKFKAKCYRDSGGITKIKDSRNTFKNYIKILKKSFSTGKPFFMLYNDNCVNYVTEQSCGFWVTLNNFCGLCSNINSFLRKQERVSNTRSTICHFPFQSISFLTGRA